MIGVLPTTLMVGEKELPIKDTDFRVVLLILQVFNDSELDQDEKIYLMLDMLLGFDSLDPDDYHSAIMACYWFIDGGKEYKARTQEPKVMDWEQDEQLIFSAVNHVAGKETRLEEYIHWWTFLGFFNEIQDGLFSYVLSIRQKKANGKKLDDSEKEYYRKNRDIIDLRKKETEEEREFKDSILAKFR